MKKSIILSGVLLVTLNSFAQTDKAFGANLVPNNDFESCTGKLAKAPGMLEETCKDWFSASDEKTDLFSAEGKAGKAGAPDNIFGKQLPQSGNNYAGIRAYSKDPKFGRTYLSIKLNEELVKDQVYCVKFQVSLADLSKFATNGLGVFVSEKKIIQPNKGDMIRTASTVDKTKVYSDIDAWETVCGSFIASGKEEYLIIGCFEEERNLKIEKVKKPASIPGVQSMHAFYYVDDVELAAVETAGKCFCKPGGVAGNREPELVYSKSVVLAEDASAADVIRASALYYASNKSAINGVAQRDLDKIAELLKTNRGMSVTVFGHVDDTEFEAGQTDKDLSTLAQDRADVVVDYLVSKGVDAIRVLPRSKNNTEPASTMKTPLSQAQNRRVTFVVK